MPTLQQLRYLAILADTLSFSRAAEQCRVAQPTLSAQIKELETKLGSRLVERTRSRVLLTPVGREVARRARRVLAEVEDIREISRRHDPAAPQGMLALGVVQSVGAYVLSVAMPDLRARFPHMRLQVREEHRDLLIRQLSEGSCDALLLPELPGRADFEHCQLMVEPLRLILPADHPLAGAETIAPAALRGETLLLPDQAPVLRQHILGLCQSHGLRPVSDYEGTTLDTLRQMVAVGMGLSLLPALYIRSEVMREQLVVARPLLGEAPERPIALIWRRDAPRRETYLALAESLQQSLAPWSARPVP